MHWIPAQSRDDKDKGRDDKDSGRDDKDNGRDSFLSSRAKTRDPVLTAALCKGRLCTLDPGSRPG